MNNEEFEEIKKVEEIIYQEKLQEFNSCDDKQDLFNSYKEYNMRFFIMLDKIIATERKDNEFALFLNSILECMNKEISSLNQAVRNNTIEDILSNFSLHDKINIISYVKDDSYNEKIDVYEKLNNKAYKLLKEDIIKEADLILSKYNISLNDIKRMELTDIQKLLNDNQLFIDIEMVLNLNEEKEEYYENIEK